MSHETNPQHLNLTELASHCAKETELYFQRQSSNTRYCFELFRRAIQEHDQAAWEMICVQYQPLVAGWVKQHHGFEASGEEVQYFVNGAFGKIAGTITPSKFDSFPDTGSLLRYLKMCVHSIIVDHNRTADQINMYALDDASDKPSADAALEEQAMDRSYRQALWDLINTRMNDEKERSVIYGSFALDLKPQELFSHFRGVFSDVDEIYQIKQNVLARLRRDSEFRKLFGTNVGTDD